MRYIADTHTLVWYFTSDQRLGKIAYNRLEGSIEKGEILIPTIVLAELLYISERGRIKLSFKDTLGKIEINDNYEIVPLDIDVLMEAEKIKPMLEMHDRLIVATAMLYDAEIITKDKQIIEAGVIKTIW